MDDTHSKIRSFLSGNRLDARKLLIIGSNGQLGKALKDKYPSATAIDSDQLDITDKQAVDNYKWSKFTHILNAAAYTNVDGAEANEELCMKINAGGVANLAKVAEAYGLTLVHISSDYVFDGTKDNHKEDERFSPISVYGHSKAEGDKMAMTSPKHYILRTSWVIGDGNNFARTMMSLANKNISPSVVCDQIGRLTFTSELVRAIDFLLTHQAPFGTYNLTNSGEPASWADITREIFKILGRSDLTVTDTTTDEYFKDKTGIAPRPLKSTLDLSKIQSLGFKPTDWHKNLVQYIKNQNSTQ